MRGNSFKILFILILGAALSNCAHAGCSPDSFANLVYDPAALKNSIFRVSRGDFSERIAHLEEQIHLYEQQLQILPPSTLLAKTPVHRIDEELSRLQQIVSALMRTGKINLISQISSIVDDANSLRRIAFMDERTIVDKGMVLVKMDPEEIQKDLARNIRRMNDHEREAHRLLIKDGLFFKTDGTLFSTIGAEPGIFVQDELGNIYAAEKGIEGTLHHSSFLDGKPVRAAGQLTVKNGKLVHLSDKSGHYLPPAICQQQFRLYLKKNKILPASYVVEFVSPAETRASPNILPLRDL